jgi:hypothetical protein
MATSADQIRNLITYLENGSAGRASIDESVASTLANIFGQSCGFRCGCPGTLVEGLRDSPISTLLRLLICPDATAVAAGLAPGAVG